jgi:hypothetical protein
MFKSGSLFEYWTTVCCDDCAAMDAGQAECELSFGVGLQHDGEACYIPHEFDWPTCFNRTRVTVHC